MPFKIIAVRNASATFNYISKYGWNRLCHGDSSSRMWLSTAWCDFSVSPPCHGDDVTFPAWCDLSTVLVAAIWYLAVSEKGRFTRDLWLVHAISMAKMINQWNWGVPYHSLPWYLMSSARTAELDGSVFLWMQQIFQRHGSMGSSLDFPFNGLVEGKKTGKPNI